MQAYDIVIDTNVIISALRSQRGASSKLLSLIHAKQFQIHLSVPVVMEYEDVLLRQRTVLGLTVADVYDLVDSLIALSKHHDIHYLWRPTLRDAKDEMVLELAVKAQCQYIVSYNQRDFVGVNQFGIEVITAKDFLEKIGEL